MGYSEKELPSEIIAGEPEQLTLSPVRTICTDPEQSRRILASIPLKMGDGAMDFIRKAFLTCHPQKDLLILKLMYMGYKHGGRIFQNLSNNVVNELNKAILHCSNEAHHLKGFIRFSDTGNALTAEIEPKNCVLPLIADHFIDRYRNENFLIYDKKHRMALIYADGVPELLTDIEIQLPDYSAEELYFRELWKTFYDSIGIKERFNPRCRMNLMPKRYWSNMPEMQDEIYRPQNAPRPSGLSSLGTAPLKCENGINENPLLSINSD